MPTWGKIMPMGGIAQGGGNFRARFERAGNYISSPPLANFSCTPLNMAISKRLQEFPVASPLYLLTLLVYP